MKKQLLITLAILLPFLCAAQPPKAEVRAIWLTTNGGSDWPTGSFDKANQTAKLTKILDKLQEANFNTVILQVQVKGDVAWVSTKQPAMKEFTGDGSKGLSYDVSEYVINECHKRNMECHAWIVPYRIGSLNEAKRYVNNQFKHPYYSHPELCVLYSGAYYLDPGIPGTSDYLLDVYKELIENYDFDGISFDYTRYPGSDFNDADSFKKYNPNAMSKDDWRRNNINTFIARFYEMAKSINPRIKVGAAPIGTYKNVPGYGNMTAYGSVYQDACQWMKSGNHDLLIPQMYWNEKYGFSPNMTTWVDNCDGRQLVVGLAPYKMLDSNDWQPEVVTDQIEKVRAKKGMSGVCFFRTEHVIGSESRVVALYNHLKNNYFKYPAHIPSMDYNGVTHPNAPRNVTVGESNGKWSISWDAPQPDELNTPIRYYTIYRKKSTGINMHDISETVLAKVNALSATIDKQSDDDEFVVTAFDHNYYESAPAGVASVDVVQANEISMSLNVFSLQINAPAEIANVSIVATDGRTISNDNVADSSITLNLSDLSHGIYFIKATLADKSIHVKKIIL